MNQIITDKSLEPMELLKNESLFHVANGYIGIRGNFEEGYEERVETVRGTYINAFHETSTIEYGERLHGFAKTKQNILNVMDAQSIQLCIDNEWFSLFSGEVLSYQRNFDLENGYTMREMLWRSPKGHTIKLRIKRMTSFEHLELYLVAYELESLDYDGEIKIVSSLDGDVANYADKNDPRVSAEQMKPLHLENMTIGKAVASMALKTEHSGLTAACCVRHKTSMDTNQHITTQGCRIDFTFAFEIKAKETFQLDKYCVFTDSIRHKLPEEASIQISTAVSNIATDCHFQMQKEYLNRFWKNSGVRIVTDVKLQQGINYNIYQLLQSVGKDCYSNISAKGLSGEGYEGHYFWDTEIYMFPFFLMTEPELAKNLLLYRASILDKARENARLLGHQKGALYPWRTISGSECSAFFPAGTAQYHINGDIAYSFVNYFLVTEDLPFMLAYGAEVLIETARLWMDTGNFCDGMFRLNSVTGPDEYTCIVNNNYYTNLIAQYNLKWAAAVCRLLEESQKEAYLSLCAKLNLSEAELLGFDAAAQQMYLPYDERLDINPQDDSFLSKKAWDFAGTPEQNYPLLLNYHPLILYRHQVCKQADTVLAHFLLEDGQKFSTIRNSYLYYERVTTHDSSLSSCIFSIMASRIGEMKKAYAYFLESVRLDLDDTHGNTKDGIHTANMGGTYLAIVFGFAGLRIRENGISILPQIPEEWEEYEFGFGYQNSRVVVLINREAVTLTLESGHSMEIRIMSLDSEYSELVKLTEGSGSSKTVRIS